jgi:phosphopantetheinyl transferase (holo-ACP synthase)
MSSFSTPYTLLACGIDSEHIERFIRIDTGKETPSPLIFSPREIEHFFSLNNSASGFCVSFCFKEALFKCELFWKPSQEKFYGMIADELCKEHAILENVVQVNMSPEGECVVTVFLLG